MSLMPTADEMYRLLKQLDTTYKSEMVLWQLHSLLFWTSVLEIALFVCLFIVFCASASAMGAIWFHVLHPARAAVGLIIVMKHLPKSHDIVELIDLEGIQDISVETISDRVQLSITAQFMKSSESAKKFLMIYSLMSIGCYVLDGLQFVVQYSAFGNKGNEHTELTMLLASIVYFAIDFYYFIWVIQLKQKLPANMSSYVSDTIFGYTSKMSNELRSLLSTQQQADLENE